MKRLLAFLLPVLALFASFAVAQSDQPITGYIDAGYSSTVGTTEDYLNDGWIFSGGAIYRPSPTGIFAVRFDVGYNYWDATNQLLSLGSSSNVQLTGGHGSMFTMTLDGILEFGGHGKIGVYVGGGFGGYRRYAELHEQVLIPGYYCDPWWGICYTGTAVGDVIVADDKLTKLGYNGVFGVTFPLKSGHELFVEASYHYMTSSEPTEYVPIVFGYRW